MDIKSLIEKVAKTDATELHMKLSSKPLVRKNNVLKPMDLPALVEADMKQLITDLLSADDIAKFEKNGTYEANYFGKPPCNFRLTLFHSQEKPVALIKIISGVIPSLRDIEFPEVAANTLSASKGLFVLTGPARSGITTSMAALIEHMNAKYRRHILVIEDPIQFNYEPKECVISQRQYSKDIYMVEQGINFAKRMDVDTLVIGDLKRDIPFKNIIEYVAGGHLVILCMQTLGCVSALEKILLSFSEDYREYVCQVLSENLLGMVSQALITTANGMNVPVHEVFIPSKNAMSVLVKGKLAQLEPNISTAGIGSELFGQAVMTKVSKGRIDRPSAEAFLEYYRNTKSS